MSKLRDIDWLRLAAERLSPDWDDAPGPCPDCRDRRIAAATAGLLRAIADEIQAADNRTAAWVMSDTLVAALGAADVTLADDLARRPR